MTATPAPALRIAGEKDIDPVAELIATAFDHLAVIRFLVPDPDRRRPVSRAWYRLYVAHAIGGAGQVVTTADGTAAAVWFDRTGPASEPADYPTRLAELAGVDRGRFEHLEQQMDTQHPAEPHWHLLFLAVRPDQWNHGLGSALMNYTHTRLDDQSLPAYLEATGIENRRLYERHGYTDMNPPAITVTDDIGLYRMWRPARNR